MARTFAAVEDQSAKKAVIITSATTLNAQQHGHRPIIITAASGAAITLPAASGGGDRYSIQLGADVSINTIAIAVNGTPGTDIIQGHLLADQDGLDAPDLVATAADTDTITFDGSTKGGYAGDWLELVDAASGTWVLKGAVKRTGTEASPFSAAVS